MKKLLHIIDYFGIGGAEKLVLSVINELEGKVEQHLIVLGEPALLIDQIKAPCKITVLSFKSYRDVWSTKNAIKNYIHDKGIEIVHSHLYWSNIISRLAVGKDVKLFNTIHAISSESSYKFSRLMLYLERISYKKRHHIIGVSGEVLKDFEKWVGIKGASTVLYNIIDDKFFAPNPKTEFSEQGLKLVAIGNLRWQKNYPYLIEAFKLLPPSISIDVYGEGDLRDELQTDIDKYNLNIRLCGHCHDLYNILPAYDLFVMCSFYEGFSLGLMEAMASGLPAILSDVPVLKEAGANAAIYVDIDKPADFADKVLYLERNKNELATLAKTAHTRAIKLTNKENHMGQLMNLYAISDAKLMPV